VPGGFVSLTMLAAALAGVFFHVNSPEVVIKHRAQYLLVFERVPRDIELYLWTEGAHSGQKVVLRCGRQDKFRFLHLSSLAQVLKMRNARSDEQPKAYNETS
jgi:hypothetical protein